MQRTWYKLFLGVKEISFRILHTCIESVYEYWYYVDCCVATADDLSPSTRAHGDTRFAVNTEKEQFCLNLVILQSNTEERPETSNITFVHIVTFIFYL